MNDSTRIRRRPRRAWPPTARTAAAIIAAAVLAHPDRGRSQTGQPADLVSVGAGGAVQRRLGRLQHPPRHRPRARLGRLDRRPGVRHAPRRPRPRYPPTPAARCLATPKHPNGHRSGEAVSKGGTAPTADAMARPAAARPRRRSEPAPAAVEGAGRPSAPAVQPPSVPGDAATRDRARQLYVEAQATGRRLTGADLGRALGTSDSYGRLLLREFRTNHPAPGNGSSREA